MRPRDALPFLAAAVLVSSCTSEQQSTPSPTLTSTTSTTTEPVAPTTTDPPVVDTTEVATTEAETTTTTTLPAGPADAVVPLVVGGADSGGWLYIGAWESDHWEGAFDDADVPLTPAIAPSTPMTVTNLEGTQEATAGSNAETCYDERVGPTLDVTVAVPEPPGFGYNGIASATHDWPLAPRPSAVTDTGPASYQALGEAIFADDTVDSSQGSVQQVVVGDLDGDGDDEAVVAFEFIQPSAGPGAPGDFASLFVVDADSRSASTVLELAVPADLPPEAFPLIERYRVLAVADFNGDGRMEVAVRSWYYEGASVLLYEYDGTTLNRVLAAGCGS